jgi:hypothetical protein
MCYIESKPGSTMKADFYIKFHEYTNVQVDSSKFHDTTSALCRFKLLFQPIIMQRY